MPATGKRCHRTANVICSINPNQNAGMAHTKNEPNESTLSPQEYLWVAASAPIGNARAIARTNALSISVIVAGSRSAIISSTGRPV